MFRSRRRDAAGRGAEGWIVSRPMATDAAGQEAGSPGGMAAAVKCGGLRYRFGDNVAVDGIDLLVTQGEVFGLLGPNGAGKTTTIRVLNTLLPLKEGTVEVLGYDVRRSPMAVRRLIGYVPQQLSIEAALTGRENVAWFARLFDVRRAERKARVAEALETMGLTEAADRLAAPTREEWSGGWSSHRLWSTGRASWSSTRRRWDSIRWHETACGSASRSFAVRPA